MKRGRGQVLYRFLPEQIVDYSDTKSIGKVSYWRCIELRELNKRRLIEIIESRKNRFDNRVYGFPQSKEDYVILEPLGIELDLYPLTFICRQCGAARRFDNLKVLRSEIARYHYHCPRCKKGVLEQQDFIHYHTCGEIESLAVRQCRIHGDSWIILNKNNSDYPKNWWWQCKACDETAPLNIGRVGAHCRNCPTDNQMAHAPFRKSDIFYPQTLSMINASSLEELISTGAEGRLMLAEYLEMIPTGRTKELLGNQRHSVDRADLLRKKKELMEKGFHEDLINEVLRGFGLTDSESEISNVIMGVHELLGLPEDDYLFLSQQLTGYTEALRMDTTRSISSVIESISGPSKERIRQSSSKLNSLGFSNAWVIVDLPIVSITYGYTRGDPLMQSCTLRAFPRNKDFPGKTPIYGLKIETEAIILELNRKRIHEWLVKNGWANGDSDLLSDKDLKAWFLRNVHPKIIPQYDPIPETDRVTWAVCNLLHSLSHLFLSKASGLVGLDKGSIHEILFPNVPAFCLFASNSQGYQLGGIVTLFENSMTYWLDRAREDVEHCLYDPVCANSEGACHACIHLPEVSCERFNRDLSRSFIIGREDERKIVGFWE